MKKKPQLYKFSEIEHRLHTLEPGQTYITVSYTHLTLPTNREV